jgi:uncharacterized protein
MINKQMKNFSNIIAISVFGLFCFLTFACNERKSKTEKQDKNTTQADKMNKSRNPVIYFEIPVTDIDRAIKFYSAVFSFEFEKDTIDKNEMALFPFVEEGSGISGALAKGEIYKPTKNGTLIYFSTTSIDSTLKLVQENGGQILYPKTSNGDLGSVAEFEDSEGNRIALHQK